MKQYLDLLNKIIIDGVEKPNGRNNMPNTIGISNHTISMNMDDGFPLLTTKKMFWKGIVHELLWFLRGDTNIKYLIDNNVNIWNQDAYRYYLKYTKEYNITPISMENFIYEIKCNKDIKIFNWFNKSDYKLGDLGKVYGYQWTNQNGINQINDVIEGLKIIHIQDIILLMVGIRQIFLKWHYLLVIYYIILLQDLF